MDLVSCSILAFGHFIPHADSVQEFVMFYILVCTPSWIPRLISAESNKCSFACLITQEDRGLQNDQRTYSSGLAAKILPS